MSLVHTTCASAVAASDTSIVVASATGFSAGYLVRVGDEQMRVGGAYTINERTVLRSGGHALVRSVRSRHPRRRGGWIVAGGAGGARVVADRRPRDRLECRRSRRRPRRGR